MDLRSNEPFWPLKNGLQHSYPSLQKDVKTDVLIVGAGITGALAAHACMGKGYETMIIDKREIGYGSTSATTSMLQYEIDVPLSELKKVIGDAGAVAAYEGCRDAIYILKDIVKQVKSESGYMSKDSLFFAGNKKDLGWLYEEYEERKKAGFSVSWLDQTDIRNKYGLIAEGGILSTDGASVDAFRLTHDLLFYNARKGLKVHDKTTLEKVIYNEKDVRVILENGCVITASKIIYCTGYETQQFLPEKIVDLKSTYAIVSEQNIDAVPRLSDTLFWNTDSPYLYMRTTDDNRLLVGGEDVDFKNPLKRDALLDRKAEKLTRLVEKLLPDYPFLLDFRWCGTFGETKDGLPYIGEHPKFPHSYFILGFGGNGITFSVLGMDIITGMIEGRSSLLSHFFRFGR